MGINAFNSYIDWEKYIYHGATRFEYSDDFLITERGRYRANIHRCMDRFLNLQLVSFDKAHLREIYKRIPRVSAIFFFHEAFYFGSLQDDIRYRLLS